jgi:CheY-like chemotaxis protein
VGLHRSGLGLSSPAFGPRIPAFQPPGGPILAIRLKKYLLIARHRISFHSYKKRGDAELLANRKPTLLVVDDERSVRQLICLNLRDFGFEVFEAPGGREALIIATTPEINIDILISDIIMPHMNGRDLANRLSSIKPFLKVLFMSAYTAEILTNFKLCPDGADFIKKPFTMVELTERISRVWAMSPKWRELVSKGS